MSDFIEINILIDAMIGREAEAKQKIRIMLPSERERFERVLRRTCIWIAEVDEEPATPSAQSADAA